MGVAPDEARLTHTRPVALRAKLSEPEQLVIGGRPLLTARRRRTCRSRRSSGHTAAR